MKQQHAYSFQNLGDFEYYLAAERVCTLREKMGGALLLFSFFSCCCSAPSLSLSVFSLYLSVKYE